MFEQIKQTFGTHFETRDGHHQEALRTQYFKTTKDRLIKACHTIIDADSKFKMIAESTERGELSANIVGKKKGLLVLSVVSVSPLKTAVDFSLTIDNGFNFGFAENLIQEFYKKLGQEYSVVD